MSNNPDDYINWPDDMSSDDEVYDLNSQGGEQTEVYSQFDEAEYTGILREVLEPEQFNSPVKMHEIPTDHKLEAFVYKEAIKYRDELRAQRIQAYQQGSASKPFSMNSSRSPRSTPIGVVYLASSQSLDDPMHRGQLNIGIYVAPNYIEERGLVHAVKQVVNEAFQDASCHRVQAIIVDHKTKLHTLEL